MSTSVPVLSSAVLAVSIAMASALPVAQDKPATTAAPDGERKVSYLREVRPILAQYCFRCHGPDEATREEDLRLDLREHAFEERGKKTVIVPGAPERSLAWLRMTTDNASKRMPPPEEVKRPSAQELETIRLWIAQGAPWEDHWAFVPPARPQAPPVANASWVRDPLDAFVLARLEQERLAPGPEASREAWLRRASFDLTGLPPTPAEIDAFVADSRPDAHEREVDRLLASPRYGERMAQEWLDLARYSDTSGYQNDTPRQVWKWREWVIEAFNANMPYDRFTVEQLAGDLLPNATLSQKVATGFNRNHPTNSEAGEEEDEYRSAYVIDRVNTTATAFMGLTLACTQCHDHKYDPLSQRDYYSFYSFFNNVKERDTDFGNPKPSISVPNPDQEPRLADLKARIEALKARLEQPEPLADAAQREWEARTLERLGAPIAWSTLAPAGLLARNGSLLRVLEDGSILSGGTAPVKDTYDVVFHPGKRRITALRIEVLPDPSLPEQGLGRASDGRFILTALELRHSSLSDSGDPPLVYLSSAQADLNQKPKEEPTGYDMMPDSIESAIVVEPVGGGDKEPRWAGRGWSIVDDERKRPHEAVLLPVTAFETNEASVLRLTLHHTSNEKFKSLIGRFRVSVTDDERVRTQLMAIEPRLWSALGPFAAADTKGAFTTAFAPEKDLGAKPLDLKKTYDKVQLAPPVDAAAKVPSKGETPKGEPVEPKAGPSAAVSAPEASAAGTPALEQPSAEKSAQEKPATSKDGEPVLATPTPGAPKPREPNAAPKEGAAVADAKPATPEAPPKPVGAQAEKRAPEKITWNEQRTWRDGKPAKLESAGHSAWYVSRMLHSTRARTVLVEIDGVAGFKLWLNGELAHAVEPAPPAPAPAKKDEAPDKDAKAAAEKKNDDDDDPVEMEEFDFSAFTFGPKDELAGSKSAKKFRIGLRAGANELVLKLVYAETPKGEGRPETAPIEGFGPRRHGGGSSFTFRITPEGEDVLNHEVVQALRLEALEAQQGATAAFVPTVPTSSGPSADADSSASSQSSAPASKTAADEPQSKVSLVGEVSAPLPTSEQANPLSLSERRRKVLREHYRTTIDPIGKVLAEELARLKAEEREVKKQVPQTLVMEELEKPRQAYVFVRGLYKNRGENVDPGTPAVLPPMDAELPRNRLGLARWLVSGRHPLTARVQVNRIWQQYFGLGLVRTAEDFGVRAELPTHPELLDLLAVEFVESGWDMKRLHKRIVLSATYRQDSAITAEKLEKDPENRLFSRGPRLRLSAEMVRDNALALSGLLFEKQGGESVKPRQPKNAWTAVEGSRTGTYVRHRDERQYRRGLYVYWKRGSPFPSMLNFDAVKRDSCSVLRATTTTPVQALTLLNDTVYVECAKMLGARLLTERQALGRARDPKPAEQDRLRLAHGFRMCTSRAPSEAELEILAKLLEEQRAHFKAHPAEAKELLEVGDARVPQELDELEAAAWATVGSAMLNLDATIHRG